MDRAGRLPPDGPDRRAVSGAVSRLTAGRRRPAAEPGRASPAVRHRLRRAVARGPANAGAFPSRSPTGQIGVPCCDPPRRLAAMAGGSGSRVSSGCRRGGHGGMPAGFRVSIVAARVSGRTLGNLRARFPVDVGRAHDSRHGGKPPPRGLCGFAGAAPYQPCRSDAERPYPFPLPWLLAPCRHGAARAAPDDACGGDRCRV